MKSIFTPFLHFLLIITTIVSCTHEADYSKIQGRWKVESVIKLEDSIEAPDMGAYFTFRNDSTIVSETEVLGTHEANWTMSENEIKMIQNQDTTIMKIEELTNSKMVLISDLGEGELKFTLLKEEKQ